MKIVNSIIRAIVERVTELEWHHKGDKRRLWVFEHLDQKGNPTEQWIQDWYTDDVTHTFDRGEQKEIFAAVDDYHKRKQ